MSSQGGASPAGEAPKSGADLLEHLKTTGTSPERVGLLEDFLKEHRGDQPTAAACVEWMIGQGWVEKWRGTVEKAGVFARGQGFVLNSPGVSAEEELTARLESQEARIKALTEQNRELAAANRRLTARNATLESQAADVKIRSSELPLPGEREEPRKGGRPPRRERDMAEALTTRAGE